MVNKKQRGNFDELLIEQVKKFPNLWDLQTPGYRDGESKVGCWTLIALALESDVAFCKAKWKNLRDDYRKILIKNRKKSQSSPNTKFDGNVKWKFYNQMQFLTDSILLHDDAESCVAVNALLDQPNQGLIDNSSQNSNSANTSRDFNGCPDKAHHNYSVSNQNHRNFRHHRQQIQADADGHAIESAPILCAYSPSNSGAPSLNFAHDVPINSALNSNTNNNNDNNNIVVSIGNGGGFSSEQEDEKCLLLMNRSSASSAAPSTSADKESAIVLSRKRPRNIDKEEIDEDIAFGKYVGLALKSMKPALKPCCKLQIQQIICGLQQDSLNSSLH